MGLMGVGDVSIGSTLRRDMSKKSGNFNILGKRVEEMPKNRHIIQRQSASR
jgi:hypothetical protein